MKQKSISSMFGIAVIAASSVFADTTDLASLPSLASVGDALEVTSVTFKQDIGTRDIVVNYTLANGSAYIKVDILTNSPNGAVSIGAENVKSFSGDVSKTSDDVFAAGEHTFRWHARKDWPDHLVDNLQVQVQAYYPDEAASIFNYAVVDLSGGTSAASYPIRYLANEPIGGWTDEYKTTKMVLRRIPAGSVSGYPEKNQSGTPYSIRLTQDYYIGVFECTKKQWQLVYGKVGVAAGWADADAKKPAGDLSLTGKRIKDNGQVKTDDRDAAIRGNVEGLKWPSSDGVDDDSFIGKLRAKTGLKFDAPTNAQWEYACRAGSSADFYWGDNVGSRDNNALVNAYSGYTWSSVNSSSAAHEVGLTTPNKWGLYDMYGNVSEYVLDKVDPSENEAGARSSFCANVSDFDDYKGRDISYTLQAHHRGLVRGEGYNNGIGTSYAYRVVTLGYAGASVGFRVVLNLR